MRRGAFVVFIPLLLLSTASCFGTAGKPAPATKPSQSTVEDVIPMTMANLRGHRMVYNEGWYVVTSSKQAFAYAREKSLVSSKRAIEAAVHEAGKETGAYGKAISKDVQRSVRTGKETVATGTAQTKNILAETHQLAKAEFAYAGEGFQDATRTFVRGNLTIAPRTAHERKELAGLPGAYYHGLKTDFSNVFALTEKAQKKIAAKIDPAWEPAFRKAAREFQAEYERSGNEPNSLMALGPILAGYLKALYHGLVAPASKTIVRTTVEGTTYAVFLPIAATTIVAGRTVQSVGLTVYYVGKTGVKIISPTIEGGMLAGLSLLSLSTVPVTYTVGGTWGALNQVAYTTVGPAAATGEAAATTAFHTAGYVGFVAYDAVKGTTQVVINQAASGIVLGYNALTAIPTHLLMGTLDTAIFLAWDGPRLVIAEARGRIASSADRSGKTSWSVGDLPVGTVVDLKKLQDTKGVTVNILSTDPGLIQKVIEKTPDDLRTKNDAEN